MKGLLMACLGMGIMAMVPAFPQHNPFGQPEPNNKDLLPDDVALGSTVSDSPASETPKKPSSVSPIGASKPLLMAPGLVTKSQPIGVERPILAGGASSIQNSQAHEEDNKSNKKPTVLATSQLTGKQQDGENNDEVDQPAPKKPSLFHIRNPRPTSSSVSTSSNTKSSLENNEQPIIGVPFAKNGQDDPITGASVRVGNSREAEKKPLQNEDETSVDDKPLSTLGSKKTQPGIASIKKPAAAAAAISSSADQTDGDGIEEQKPPTAAADSPVLNKQQPSGQRLPPIRGHPVISSDPAGSISPFQQPNAPTNNRQQFIFPGRKPVAPKPETTSDDDDDDDDEEAVNTKPAAQQQQNIRRPPPSSFLSSRPFSLLPPTAIAGAAPPSHGAPIFSSTPSQRRQFQVQPSSGNEPLNRDQAEGSVPGSGTFFQLRQQQRQQQQQQRPVGDDSSEDGGHGHGRGRGGDKKKQQQNREDDD